MRSRWLLAVIALSVVVVAPTVQARAPSAAQDQLGTKLPPSQTSGPIRIPDATESSFPHVELWILLVAVTACACFVGGLALRRLERRR